MLAGFGAEFPKHLAIAPCEAAPTVAATGSGGLVDGSGTSTFGYVAIVIATLAVGGVAVAARGRIRARA